MCAQHDDQFHPPAQHGGLVSYLIELLDVGRLKGVDAVAFLLPPSPVVESPEEGSQVASAPHDGLWPYPETS
jgi:hypothetical protein